MLYREGREYSALQVTKDSYVQKQRERKLAPGSTSFAVDESRPLPDDYVVLVRSGNSFGCFIPRNQHKKGESLEYDWYYRTDGLAQFNPEDLHVRSGHSFAGPYVSGSGPFVTVAFGPFIIEWSGNGPAWGFLYYVSRHSSDENPADQLRICTTNCKTVEYLDGRSAEWIYKASVRDVGLPGNVDAAPLNSFGNSAANR